MSENGDSLPTSSWYAAKLRFVVLIETTGAEHGENSIYLLRSDSFEGALARALEIGRLAEHEYLGATGEHVRWRLKEIVTLDVLQAADLDGVEVHSELTPLREDERYSFEHVFKPEASQPRQTGVV
jgi:hypothetical protein